MSKNRRTEPAKALSTKARVLVDVVIDGRAYLSGSLLEADADEITRLGGQVDTHPEAVAFCEKEINNG